MTKTTKQSNHLIKLLTIILSLLLIESCTDTDNKLEDLIIELETPTVDNITTNSADIHAKIKTTSFKEKGICYSTGRYPNIHSNVAKYSGDSESFVINLSKLNFNTTYYVRSYLIDQKDELHYSEITSFTTLDDEKMSVLNDYTPPRYSDDYTSIADWGNHSQWNLANVHDPTVFKAHDGYYYMYQTDASYGGAAEQGGGHFYCRRSKDLVNWEYLGGCMQETPRWIKEKLNEYRTSLNLPKIDSPNYGYWAPVARKVNDGLYRLYYSIPIHNAIDGEQSWGERAFIGLMEASDPASNNWKDKGFVICSSSNRGTDWSRLDEHDWNGYFKWNAIDPSYIITPKNEHWLIYGSWHSGIAAVELDANSGKPKSNLPNPWGTDHDISAYGVTIAKRNHSRWQGSEAPEIIYRNNYYYLFLAYDAVDVPYNTRVVRSKNILGPYHGIDGTNVTEGGEAYPLVTHPYKFKNDVGWVGLSHCAIFNDNNDNWFYASQGRLPKDVPGIHASNAVMMGHVRSIRWTDDDWPVVMPQRYGAVPKVAISSQELVGSWEYIQMRYEYSKQQQSVNINLTSDHRIDSGIWKGKTWSYDENNEVLIIDNKIKLYLQREVDWEANPRSHTIVFSGYDGRTTYWGKKTH